MPDTATAAARPRAATKAEVLRRVAENSGLTRRDVAAVLDALAQIVAEDLAETGPGVFVVPGLVRLRAVRKPAMPERRGVNPFTKAPMTIKAKPARTVVKATPAKALRDAAGAHPCP